MILSYRDKRTRTFADGIRIKDFHGFERQAYRRLAFLRQAMSVNDLASLPGNRFETLRGDRAGQFSIRINDQWRLCFRWEPGDDGASDVEIVDYH